MITVENDIVAGDVLLWLRGNFYDSFGSIRNGRYFRSAVAAIRSGSKMGCGELCNFHFCCASISCQPMKKFEFFGATRATRQRHSKTSSTGDEDAVFPVKSRKIKEMTRGDKGKLFSLFVPLFTLPTQQDCVLPVA